MLKIGNEIIEQIETELNLQDTGWIYPTLNSGWSVPYGNAPARYRRIGNVVFIEGFLDASSGASDVIFTLPAGFRPLAQFKRVPVYTAGGFATCSFEYNGDILWLNKGSSSTTWFCINSSFITRD